MRRRCGHNNVPWSCVGAATRASSRHRNTEEGKGGGHGDRIPRSCGSNGGFGKHDASTPRGICGGGLLPWPVIRWACVGAPHMGHLPFCGPPVALSRCVPPPTADHAIGGRGAPLFGVTPCRLLGAFCWGWCRCCSSEWHPCGALWWTCHWRSAGNPGLVLYSALHYAPLSNTRPIRVENSVGTCCAQSMAPRNGGPKMMPLGRGLEATSSPSGASETAGATYNPRTAQRLHPQTAPPPPPRCPRAAQLYTLHSLTALNLEDLRCGAVGTRGQEAKQGTGPKSRVVTDVRHATRREHA